MTKNIEKKTRESLIKCPDEITVCQLDVVVMPNGEIICAGKTVGWFENLSKYLSLPE